MNEIELLSWVRGPAFQAALIIFIVGVIIRITEIVMLGRKPNLAEPKGSEMKSGLKTILTRSGSDIHTFRRNAFTTVSSYMFHIGLLSVIFLYAPHILWFKELTSLSWPALPSQAIDALAVVTILAMLAMIVHRFLNNVLRFLSTFEDYLVWLVTLLPLITGYLAFHRIGASPSMLLSLHLLSVELLMIVFPFTRLMHAFTIFFSRWYNGAISGYRGVQS